MSMPLVGAPAWPSDPDRPDGSAGQPLSGHVRQADGTPVSGATVTLLGMSGQQVSRGRTGADGSYQIRVPHPGMYTLVATAAARQPLAVAVHAGGAPMRHDVLLAGAAMLAGSVRAAGVGTPIRGASVALADSSGEVMATRSTDDAGRYLFGEIAPGRYTLAVSATSYQPSALPVTVADRSRASVDVDLHGNARVEGTARNAHGMVVPDARITLVDPEGNVAAVVTTGPDGRYIFENLPEDDYTVIASGYPPSASTLRITSDQPQFHDVRLVHPEA